MAERVKIRIWRPIGTRMPWRYEHWVYDGRVPTVIRGEGKTIEEARSHFRGRLEAKRAAGE